MIPLLSTRDPSPHSDTRLGNEHKCGAQQSTAPGTTCNPTCTTKQSVASSTKYDSEFSECNDFLTYLNYPTVDYTHAGFGPCNRHHLLFFKRAWAKGTGENLRELPYFSYYLPVKSLHDDLHALMHSGIPYPENGGRLVASAYRWIEAAMTAGDLSDSDSVPKRITVLIKLFAASPETVHALRRQLAIITAFDARHQLVAPPAASRAWSQNPQRQTAGRQVSAPQASLGLNLVACAS